MKSGHELDFCLLVPCYNNFNGLVASLKTVVYPHDKFLVVIVDDGSDPPLRKDEILQEVGNMFPIQLITGRKNLGITAALNAGLVWIVENTNTAYIARLDCGDLCAPERFTLQVSHLREHPDIGLIGTWCLFRGKKFFERVCLQNSHRASRYSEANAFQEYFYPSYGYVSKTLAGFCRFLSGRVHIR